MQRCIFTSAVQNIITLLCKKDKNKVLLYNIVNWAKRLFFVDNKNIIQYKNKSLWKMYRTQHLCNSLKWFQMKISTGSTWMGFWMTRMAHF